MEKCGKELAERKLIEKMLEDEEKWDAVDKEILGRKKNDESARKQNRRSNGSKKDGGNRTNKEQNRRWIVEIQK